MVTEGGEREDANAGAAKTNDERGVSAVALHLEKCRHSIDVYPAGTGVQFSVDVDFAEGWGVDWDLSAVFLGPDGRMWAADSLVFYGRPEDSRPAVVWLHGNDDNELPCFEVRLSSVDPRTHSILAVVTAFQGQASESAGLGGVCIMAASIRDSRTGEMLCELHLTEDARGHTACVIGALRRRGSGWEFVTSSEYFGNSTNGLEDVLGRYSPPSGD